MPIVPRGAWIGWQGVSRKKLMFGTHFWGDTAMYMRVYKTGAFWMAVLAVCLIGAPQVRASEEGQHSGQSEVAAQAEHGEADAHGEAGEHGEQEVNLNPLDYNDLKGDLALWTGVVFVLLLLVLGKFAWGPIADGLDKRELRIAGEIAAAEKANADAKAQLKEYQQKLAAAGDEVRHLIEQAKRDAEAAGQTIVQKARDEGEAEKRRAIEDIELATAGALKDLAEQSANLAVDLAGKIVQQRLSADEHSALINEAVAKFAKLEPGKN